MAASLIYRMPAAYGLVMRALYGRHYAARHRAIAGLIPGGSSVLDLCCGPGTLFERHLRHQGVDYTGLDLSPRFVARVTRLGGRAMVRDLHDGGPLPPADYVIMQASLYHFLPDPTPLLGRMFEAARRRVIVAEPIRNLADSGRPWLSALARRLTDAGRGDEARRFDERSLDALLGTYPARSRECFLIPGGREKVYVLEPDRPRD